MASSHNTYNVFLDYSPFDGLVVKSIACKLHRSGLRPYFEKWSTVSYTKLDEHLNLALSASLVVVSIIGVHGLACWNQNSLWDSNHQVNIKPDITVLAPGFPNPLRSVASHVSGGYVIDLRNGLNDAVAWKRLVSLILKLGHEAETIINPYRSLSPIELKRNTIRSYNHIAEQFAAQWFEYPPMAPLEKLLQRLPERSRILDAGCGPGHHAKVLAASGHEVVGIDLSDVMLNIARRSVRTVHFEKMDIQMLLFPPKMFDAIWCAAAVLHIPREEIVSTLIGFRHILKPGGVLGLNLQIGRPSEVVERGKDSRFFEYYRNTAEIETLMNLAGFTVESQDYGETTRNTHALALTIMWATLYAKPTEPYLLSANRFNFTKSAE